MNPNLAPYLLAMSLGKLCNFSKYWSFIYEFGLKIFNLLGLLELCIKTGENNSYTI